MSELVLIEAILKQSVSGKLDIDAIMDILKEPGLDQSICNADFINEFIYKITVDNAFETDIDEYGEIILRELDDGSVYHRVLLDLYQLLSEISTLEEFTDKINERGLSQFFINNEEIQGVFNHFMKSYPANYKSMLFPNF